ncbi:MAG: hypothetical protein PVI74_12570, partial [Syntrophobacterales bacterium]
TKKIITSRRLVKMRKSAPPITGLWAVIMDQPFAQFTSGYPAKFGYLTNKLTMMKRYILLVL